MKMMSLRSHGITKDPADFQFPTISPWVYEQQDLGFNYRITDLQAALGISQLNRLQSIIERRNHLHKNYRILLQDLPIDLLAIPNQCKSSIHLAVIKLPFVSEEKHREFFNFMRNSSVGVQVHYIPIHLQPYYRNLGFKPGDFPNSEKYAIKCMSIPLFYDLREEDQVRIVRVLSKALDYVDN